MRHATGTHQRGGTQDEKGDRHRNRLCATVTGSTRCCGACPFFIIPADAQLSCSFTMNQNKKGRESLVESDSRPDYCSRIRLGADQLAGFFAAPLIHNSIGEATKIELYVPAMTPTTRAKAKL